LVFLSILFGYTVQSNAQNWNWQNWNCPSGDHLCVLRALENSSPRPNFANLAGNLKVQTFDAVEAFGRMNTALSDPIVISRAPNTTLSPIVGPSVEQGYGVGGVAAVVLVCQEVTFNLKRGSKIIASEEGDCNLPEEVFADRSDSERASYVNLAHLMAHFFSAIGMPQEDLLKLLQSQMYEIRYGAVDNLRDQGVLAEVALEIGVHAEGEVNIGEDAISKLEDQTLLAKIANKGENALIRTAAVNKLQDQAVLAEIVLGSQDESVRFNALHNLHNQAMLEKIALEKSEYPDIRASAIGKLQDQALLAKIAMDKREYPDIRTRAIDKLQDQALLAKIALERNEDLAIRQRAMQDLQDQALLAEIASQNCGELVRSMAVDKLKDQALLAKIALGEGEFKDLYLDVRKSAINKLQDQALLAKIAASEDESGDVRDYANARLNELRAGTR
jgi:hypothetical protein